MRRRTGKSARHARTGHALRPAQRQADDRRNRRLKTILVQGRFVFRRSSCVAAALPGPCSALCTTVPPNRSDTSVCALGHNRRTRRLPVLRRMAVCRGGHARCRGDRQSRRAASGSVLGLLRSEPDVGQAGAGGDCRGTDRLDPFSPAPNAVVPSGTVWDPLISESQVSLSQEHTTARNSLHGE